MENKATSQPSGFQIRFLFVFRFAPQPGGGPDLLRRCKEALLAPQTGPGDPALRAAWEVLQPPGAAEGQGTAGLPEGYVRELLPEVVRLFFGGASAAGSLYFRVGEGSPEDSGRVGRDALAGNLLVRPPWDVPNRFQARGLHGGAAAVELFLHAFDHGDAPEAGASDPEDAPFEGFGALSIRLGAEHGDGIPLEEIRELTYFLSQRTHRPAATLGRRFPTPDSPDWSRLEPARQAVVRRTLAWEAWRREHRGTDAGEGPPLPVLADRLRHGWFTLEELRGWLLGPLDALLRIEPVQGQFAVFTAVRFPASVSFADPAACAALAPALSALAQVEEKGHAGSRPGEVTAPHAVLNTCHWAAAGGQAAAHFLCDQHDPPRGFDHQRVPLVQERYFLPHLLVLLQDAALGGLARRAFALARRFGAGPDRDAPGLAAAARRLRTALARFDALYLLPQVSDREAHNRHYHLVREALRIETVFAAAGRAVAGLDALAAEASRQRLVEAVAAGVRGIAEAQTKVEYVEIFLVGVYSIYVTHYVGYHFQFHHAYVGVSLLAISLGTALLAAMKMQLWKHAHLEPGQEPFWPPGFVRLADEINTQTNTLSRLLRAVLLILGLYLLLGFTLFRDAAAGGH